MVKKMVKCACLERELNDETYGTASATGDSQSWHMYDYCLKNGKVIERDEFADAVKLVRDEENEKN